VVGVSLLVELVVLGTGQVACPYGGARRGEVHQQPLDGAEEKGVGLVMEGHGQRLPSTPRTSDYPQEQGITVAPLNVEVRYRSAGARRKSYLFPTTKVSQVLVDYALNKFKEQGG
jgi:hypothetical protein